MFLKGVTLLLLFLYNIRLHDAHKTKRDTDDVIWGDDNFEDSVTVDTRIADLESATSSDSCTCVPYYLCDNGTINTSGEGIIDIRLNDCDSYLENCCGDNNIIPEPSPSPPPQANGCGFRNPNGVGFKIQQQVDKEAEFGEFPWMTAVFHKKERIKIYKCGGALIHPQVVLTAAHCVKSKENLSVRVGEWDTQTIKERYPFQDINVASVVIHPQYKPAALVNDIALLFLEEAVQPAPHIDVICLPPHNIVVDRSRCFSSGWGRDQYGKKGVYQVILKKIDLPMVPRKQCQNYLRKTRLGKLFTLHESFVCAGGEAGKDTCTGDGGSPLVCPIEGQPDRYFQVGIVAWGVGCGEDMVPGVYVNVAKFRKWIDDQVGRMVLDIRTYDF